MKAALLFLALVFCNYGISQKPDDSMVLIPSGEFIMGKNSATPSDWQPEHPIKVNFGKLHKGILKVGTYPPNGFRLYDITGNVREWTSDFYGSDYYANSPAKNPTGPEKGRFKVIRGGSWHSGPMCVQTYYRNGLSPSWVDFAVGFRCVKDIK